MQGPIANSADQDQKRVVTRFIVRSGLSSPSKKEVMIGIIFFEFNFNYIQENRNNYLST